MQLTHHRLPRHPWFCGRRDNGITDWESLNSRPIRESRITITIVRRASSYCLRPMNSQPSSGPDSGLATQGARPCQLAATHCPLSVEPAYRVSLSRNLTSRMNSHKSLAMQLVTRTGIGAWPDMWLLRDLTTEKTLYCGSTPNQNIAILGFVLKQRSSFIIYNVDGRSSGSLARETLISEIRPLKGEAESSSWRE